MKPPCVILAGGRSSRMGGGDKCLLPLAGKSMLAHVLDRVSPQVSTILINSNSPPDRFITFGRPVLPDVIGGFQGPLAGLLTGMRWAAQAGASHMISVACDTPFLPHDLVQRLYAGLGGNEIAIACDLERSHPVIGLWPTALAGRLAHDMEQHDIRGMHQWLRSFAFGEVAFAASHFSNLNTPAELRAAEAGPPPDHSPKEISKCVLPVWYRCFSAWQ